VRRLESYRILNPLLFERNLARRYSQQLRDLIEPCYTQTTKIIIIIIIMIIIIMLYRIETWIHISEIGLKLQRIFNSEGLPKSILVTNNCNCLEQESWSNENKDIDSEIYMRNCQNWLESSFIKKFSASLYLLLEIETSQ